MLRIVVNEQEIEQIVDGIHAKVSFVGKKEEETIVKEIMDNVKSRGDEALFGYTRKYDSVHLDETTLKVSNEEIKEAYEKVEKGLIESLELAIKNIKEHHLNQVPESWLKTRSNGAKHGIRYTPINRVGLYVPGGTAVYPSTVLMNAIPAIVANVKELVIVVPPMKNGKVHPLILVAADLLGVKEIYKVGGAQAVAALTFGTKIIKKVDKIVGPGNIFVTIAKKMVYGLVDIDKMAGPSDICVVASGKNNPRVVAADLLSQAEHDKLASSVLITDSIDLAYAVQKEIFDYVQTAERKEILEASLLNNSAAFIISDLAKAPNLINKIAPEHLEIMVDNPEVLIKQIEHAGAIFIGNYTPEAIGDYIGGTNHVLPTGGTAKFSSPLGVDDFLKKSSIIEYSKEAFNQEASHVIALASAEGLEAHALSVKVRLA